VRTHGPFSFKSFIGTAADSPINRSSLTVWTISRSSQSIGMQPIPPLSPLASIRLSITVLRARLALKTSNRLRQRFNPSFARCQRSHGSSCFVNRSSIDLPSASIVNIVNINTFHPSARSQPSLMAICHPAPWSPLSFRGQFLTNVGWQEIHLLGETDHSVH